MKKLTIITLAVIFSFLQADAFGMIVPQKGPTIADTKDVESGSYYDMDMSKIAQEVGFELKDEEKEMLNDLRFLWPYAVDNSETIKFAIYKLSDNEDPKKNDENKVKNILKPIAAIAPMAAMGSASSVLGGSALIGGSFLQEVLQGGKTPLQKHIEKVSDTDLVILAKSVEELQTKLVLTYYDYITAKKVLFMSDEILKNRYKYYSQMQNSSDKNLVIADTFYRDAILKQTKAREDFLIKRSSLEQIVGNEAIVLLEQEKQQSKNPEKELQSEQKTETAPAAKESKSKEEQQIIPVPVTEGEKSLKDREKEVKKTKTPKTKVEKVEKEDKTQNEASQNKKKRLNLKLWKK